MSRVLLSAALIARNEENFLGTCLASLQHVAEEIIVVDTGSKDRTKEIAQAAGVKVCDFAWTGDFSAARNRALELSTGQWILYIDADEQVRADSIANLRSELLNPDYAGYEILLHPVRGYTSYWVLRLFRNDPSIRFSGIIHESTRPALRQYCTKYGGKIGRSSMVIDHNGYEGDQSAKDARNLPLLQEYLQQEPDRIYCWCHLANSYTATNQPELAEEAWQKALAVIRKKGVRGPEDVLPYVAVIDADLQRGRDVWTLFREALSSFPNSVQLHWLRGRILLHEGEYTGAIAVFQELIDRGQSGKFDHLTAHDLRLFGSFAYDAIATCYFRLGNYAQSRRYYDLAARKEPDQLAYRVKRSLSSRLEQKAAEHQGSIGTKTCSGIEAS